MQGEKAVISVEKLDILHENAGTSQRQMVGADQGPDLTNSEGRSTKGIETAIAIAVTKAEAERNVRAN